MDWVVGHLDEVAENLPWEDPQDLALVNGQALQGSVTIAGDPFFGANVEDLLAGRLTRDRVGECPNGIVLPGCLDIVPEFPED